MMTSINPYHHRGLLLDHLRAARTELDRFAEFSLDWQKQAELAKLKARLLYLMADLENIDP